MCVCERVTGANVRDYEGRERREREARAVGDNTDNFGRTAPPGQAGSTAQRILPHAAPHCLLCAPDLICNSLESAFVLSVAANLVKVKYLTA